MKKNAVRQWTARDGSPGCKNRGVAGGVFVIRLKAGRGAAALVQRDGQVFASQSKPPIRK
ncbi:hypothetical protein [uncultured Methylovirgula sp.]|uniref:hypothetical protein n=1 Tax=uncultured Methylovirgula sp. TaxID=1285960 RepID=UPI0026125CBE|nr:hypothetical protein [uncultured Methylovirgula sp.]